MKLEKIGGGEAYTKVQHTPLLCRRKCRVLIWLLLGKNTKYRCYVFSLTYCVSILISGKGIGESLNFLKCLRTLWFLFQRSQQADSVPCCLSPRKSEFLQGQPKRTGLLCKALSLSASQLQLLSSAGSQLH